MEAHDDTNEEFDSTPICYLEQHFSCQPSSRVESKPLLGMLVSNQTLLLGMLVSNQTSPHRTQRSAPVQISVSGLKKKSSSRPKKEIDKSETVIKCDTDRQKSQNSQAMAHLLFQTFCPLCANPSAHAPVEHRGVESGQAQVSAVCGLHHVHCAQPL